MKRLYSVSYKGINNIIYKEKRVVSGKAKGRIHQRNKRHTSVEKQLIMILCSSPSENARLLKMKAVPPPAEQQPRSPKAKPASETSAPGSDTLIYQSVFLLVESSKSNFIHTCVCYLSVVLSSCEREIKVTFFKDSVIISFYTSSFEDTVTVDFKTMY